MLPVTLLAGHKLAALFTNANALSVRISDIAAASGASVPGIPATQVVLSATNPEIGDNNLQLLYPRVCIYSGGIKNTQVEKFRSLSGLVSTAAEIWASGNLVSDVDKWIHYYVEAAISILQENIGDWGDGIFYSGAFEVQLQQPRVGGLGYVANAKVTCTLNISRT
jgi:hypothetical protein